MTSTWPWTINHDDVVVVLLDLWSAFDTIDHGVLVKRLYTRFGLRGLALAWIESYLSNRSQSVVMKNVRSASADLVCGVPQGTALMAHCCSSFMLHPSKILSPLMASNP